MVWNFELYMVPLSLLIVFMKNLLVVQIVGNLMKDKEENVRITERKFKAYQPCCSNYSPRPLKGILNACVLSCIFISEQMIIIIILIYI